MYKSLFFTCFIFAASPVFAQYIPYDVHSTIDQEYQRNQMNSEMDNARQSQAIEMQNQQQQIDQIKAEQFRQQQQTQQQQMHQFPYNQQ